LNEPRTTTRASADRVLVVASELPPGPGGIGTHAHAVAVELSRQGRDVALLASQHFCTEAEREAFNAACEISVTTFADGPDPVRTAVRRLRQLLHAIQSFQPDVVLASGGRVIWLAHEASRRSGVPFVAVVHGTELGGPAWQRLLTRRSLDHASRIVAVSKFTMGLVHDLGVTRPEIAVITNGADGERFRADPDARASFRARHNLGDRPIILTVGNVTERKGQHLVVDALPTVLASSPDAVYVTVGRPTESLALQERARALGVLDHVVMLGQVEPQEVAAAHAAADVFAMTSTNTANGDVEGFGIAVLEAALSGVPAVVTTGTGAEEAVADGVTGLAVSASGDAIARALIELLTDPRRRAAMGDSAQSAARSKGTWAHCAERYGEILDSVKRGSNPRIVVVSHTEHYQQADGSIVAFGPTTRELDHLASLASELVHVAPLHPGPPPGMALPIEAPNIRFVAVPPAGGAKAVDRVMALTAVPRWALTINRELRKADVAHVRCPAGISMVALAVLALRRAPGDRWVKYAGNWSPNEPDALTYRVQRAWLTRGWARAVITVNGRWPDQPPWVRAFDNPTLTEAELAAGRQAAASKADGPPHRVVFAGRLESPKGADVAVETVLELRRRGHDVVLDLIGDGPLRPWVEARSAADATGSIRLHGWVPRAELEQFLARGHVFLLPTSASEGFPKVIGEAMAFGCVPVTSGVSSMGQVLRETGGAVIVEPEASWPDAVQAVILQTRAELMAVGIDHVNRFSYQTYLGRVRAVARADWDRDL
jgi:phosphatidylinositol alpha-1,6-mannosyltransferase